MQDLRTDDLYRGGARPSLQEAPPNERRLGEDGFRQSLPSCGRASPSRARHTLFLDGEKILRTPEAVGAMSKSGVRVLPDWPPHSPDLNPQEHMWAWAEPRLRKEEKTSDSFSVFQRRALVVCKKYPAPEKLVPGMAERSQHAWPVAGARREVRCAAPGSCATIAHHGSPLLQRVDNGGMTNESATATRRERERPRERTATARAVPPRCSNAQELKWTAFYFPALANLPGPEFNSQPPFFHF